VLQKRIWLNSLERRRFRIAHRGSRHEMTCPHAACAKEMTSTTLLVPAEGTQVRSIGDPVRLYKAGNSEIFTEVVLSQVV
jgi:hypothetical protein